MGPRMGLGNPIWILSNQPPIRRQEFLNCHSFPAFQPSSYNNPDFPEFLIKCSRSRNLNGRAFHRSRFASR